MPISTRTVQSKKHPADFGPFFVLLIPILSQNCCNDDVVNLANPFLLRLHYWEICLLNGVVKICG